MKFRSKVPILPGGPYGSQVTYCRKQDTRWLVRYMLKRNKSRARSKCAYHLRGQHVELVAVVQVLYLRTPNKTFSFVPTHHLLLRRAPPQTLTLTLHPTLRTIAQLHLALSSPDSSAAAPCRSCRCLEALEASFPKSLLQAVFCGSDVVKEIGRASCRERVCQYV